MKSAARCVPIARFAACCLLPAACCLLPAACCLLPAACCLLPAACCLRHCPGMHCNLHPFQLDARVTIDVTAERKNIPVTPPPVLSS
jgi:hypothetical protein